ncbi:MAG TPA: PH domain-containing protein [Iamia sp.]
MASIIDKARAVLDPGEEVLSVVVGSYVTEVRRPKGVLMATDRRVVFYGSKVVGDHVATVTYDQISSVGVSSGLLGATVRLVAGGATVVELNRGAKADAEAFARIVRERQATT